MERYSPYPNFYNPDHVRGITRLTKEKKTEEATPKPPFTAEQEARLREIVDEQLAKYDKQKLHEARFGKPYPPKEHK